MSTNFSNPEHQKQETNCLYNIFQQNEFPQNFIQKNAYVYVKCLCKRQYCHISKISQKQPIDYYNHMASLYNRNQLKPPKNILKNKQKSPVIQELKTRVIYNIQFKDCNRYCVGQTGRRLAECIHIYQAARRHDENTLIS